MLTFKSHDLLDVYCMTLFNNHAFINILSFQRIFSFLGYWVIQLLLLIARDMYKLQWGRISTTQEDVRAIKQVGTPTTESQLCYQFHTPVQEVQCLLLP